MGCDELLLRELRSTLIACGWSELGADTMVLLKRQQWKGYDLLLNQSSKLTPKSV